MKRTFITRKITALAAIAVLATIGTTTASAQIIWTGAANDGLYSDGNNWQGDAPPADNGYQDKGAEFNTGTATITVPNGQTVSGIKFDTAGWTLSASTLMAGDISSSGTGTNTLTGIFDLYNGTTNFNGYAEDTFNVATGNTLSLGGMYEGGTNAIVTGGGTLFIGSLTNPGLSAGIGGYGEAAASFGLYLGSATLQIDATEPYDTTGGAIFLTSSSSVLLLKGTAANAESYFGTEIVGQVSGGTLTAVNAGNGYAEVTDAAAVVPEPTTIAYLLTGGIGLILIARRRARA